MDLSPERFLEIFEAASGRSVSVRDVLAATGAPSSYRRMAQGVLESLAREGRLVRVGSKRFMLPQRGPRETGTLHVSEKGSGFLLRPGHDAGDLYIHRTNLAGALDGDQVEVEIFTGRRGSKEGRVTAALKRAHEHVVGQFRRTGRGGIVTPRNVKIGRWIEIPSAPPKAELADGAWVRVRITEWSNGPEEPLLAELEEVLGMPGDRGISVLVLLCDMGVELEFPPEALRLAQRFHAPATASEIKRRRDLRGLAVCTIDPVTAKDFDDALSIEVLDSGNRLLGVHIADVAHYVHAGKAIDVEALRRGTSIYPVDRVVPMLPERLSNDLCSLRPDEDRYALTCFMEITKHGEVVRHEIVESVIRSRHRLHYGEVQEFFDRQEERGTFRFADIGDDLLELRALARVLNQARMDRGALDLDLPEIEIECNPEGDPIALHRHARFESHRLVEECMLIANETVAQHMRTEGLPLLYRIHDVPDPHSLERIAPALALFGVKVPKKVEPKPAFYQALVEGLHRADGGHIGQRLLLGTLMRAEYSPVNRGHFGLASKCYCHFTSPIRRYPDLLTHRVLKDFLTGTSEEPDYRENLAASIASIANQSNLTAENAESIEDETVRMKTMEFMQDQQGGIFEGWISGITRRGFFVELIELPVEGFVSIRTLLEDRFEADPAFTRLVGRFTKKSFRLGQRARVQIARVNVAEGEMELILVEDSRRGKKKKGRSGR